MKSNELELLACGTAPRTEELMEDFVYASARSGNSPRELYFIRETMQSLVRLAQSEQMLDIRRSVDKLVPASMRAAGRRRRITPNDPPPGQAQFVFGRDN